MTQTDRRHDRERVNIDAGVMVTTITDAGEATLVNLNEMGALIAGMTAQVGSRMQIDYAGQTVFGIVAWAEEDRFGVRFPFMLVEGPLYQLLIHARMAQDVAQSGVIAHNGIRPAALGFGRRRS